jgi:hypothetical protein
MADFRIRHACTGMGCWERNVQHCDFVPGIQKLMISCWLDGRFFQVVSRDLDMCHVTDYTS